MNQKRKCMFAIACDHFGSEEACFDVSLLKEKLCKYITHRQYDENKNLLFEIRGG